MKTTFPYAMSHDLLDKIEFDGQGLIPAILQDANTGRVLMLAYMNRESLGKTLATGHCWFYSRSRQRLWEKGATSGNYQFVQSIQRDCDGDALLIQIKNSGPACHLGTPSCFDHEASESSSSPTAFFRVVAELATLIHGRHLERPEGSYTTMLFDTGIKKIAQKLGEEGLEVALAAVGEDEARVAEESADLIYHLLVLLEARGLSLNHVGEVLRKRADQKS